MMLSVRPRLLRRRRHETNVNRQARIERSESTHRGAGESRRRSPASTGWLEAPEDDCPPREWRTPSSPTATTALARPPRRQVRGEEEQFQKQPSRGTPSSWELGCCASASTSAASREANAKSLEPGA